MRFDDISSFGGREFAFGIKEISLDICLLGLIVESREFTIRGENIYASWYEEIRGRPCCLVQGTLDPAILPIR